VRRQTAGARPPGGPRLSPADSRDVPSTAARESAPAALALCRARTRRRSKGVPAGAAPHAQGSNPAAWREGRPPPIFLD
jgi:hypothetical protein